MDTIKKETTTRTSPFGKYVTCQCGWVSAQYRPTHEEAWQDWQDHNRSSHK